MCACTFMYASKNQSIDFTLNTPTIYADMAFWSVPTSTVICISCCVQPSYRPREQEKLVTVVWPLAPLLPLFNINRLPSSHSGSDCTNYEVRGCVRVWKAPGDCTFGGQSVVCAKRTYREKVVGEPHWPRASRDTVPSFLENKTKSCCPC